MIQDVNGTSLHPFYQHVSARLAFKAENGLESCRAKPGSSGTVLRTVRPDCVQVAKVRNMCPSSGHLSSQPAVKLRKRGK